MTKNKKPIPVHITWDKGQKKWKVISEGATRAYRRFSTQEEAEKIGKELAKKRGTDFIPHNKLGKITNPNSYGKDPFPPKDNKK